MESIISLFKILNLILFLFFMMFFNMAFAQEELSLDIIYIHNDGVETKNQILCKNSNEAFIYENNVTKEIRLEYDGRVEEFGKVTIDEVIEKVCQ